MGVVRKYAERKAIEKVPSPVLETAGKAVLKAVDTAVEQRWDHALARAERAEGETVEERVKSVTKRFSRELTSVGAATGATAAVPGLGTAGAVSLLVAEVGWFAFRVTDLIMTIGAVYGHTDSTPEERRAWVLSVLAFGESAADEFAALIQGINQDVTLRSGKVGAVVVGVLQGDVATVDALRRVNTTLAARVATRYGSRKGAALLGKLLPFGVGAVVGSTANWALGKAVSSQTRRFFDGYHLVVVPPPPKAIDAVDTVLDADGTDGTPSLADLPPPPMPENT